jgi:ParB/RepB/Spo0J family partition protein
VSVKPTGLPPAAKMRHDAHYVEEITSRGGIAIGRMIPIEEIEPNAGQPRRDAGDLQRLTESVREMGVLNPLLVRFLPDSGKYGIISGQRRYQAASAAGLSELPCIEKDVDDAEAIEIALTENLHHKELTSSEQAIWIHELARLGMTHEEIASRVGKLPLSITSSSVGPHPETAEAMIPVIPGGNLDGANNAVYLTEAEVAPGQPACLETHSSTAGEAMAEASATPEPAAPEQSQGVVVPVPATEGLLEEAKSSILTAVRSIAGRVEDELKGCLALQRDACIQELVVQSNNVVRNAVSRVRAETEEIVQAGCARISNRLDSTAVALRECEQQFQAGTKADAQEGAEAFRKQANLLADEILGQTRQAVTSMLDDLRNRMQKAASTL